MTDIRVPTLGESVTEATVATWFKKAGDAVAVDEMLCELETDKVTVEVPAPAAGVLSEIIAPEGETVGVNALLAMIGEGSGAAPAPAPDLLGRSFWAEQPNEKWCGDITYVKTWKGWGYDATVIDLYSRKVIGYAVADHMKTSLVIAALDMALDRRRPPAGVIFHSDRGTQYTSKEFADYCAKHRVRRSLGRTGICYDNAVAETTFASYKKELIHTRPWPDVDDLAEATADWFENYFNRIRRHSYLDYLTPQEYELGYRDLKQLAA